MVHVRQFERWGPFMGPAYLISSFMLWIIGRRPYRDNPFEREAFGEEGDEAIRLDPESATRDYTLAWLLATCPDSRYRDGAKAVQLAEKACELTDYTDASSLYLLAAAHAEKGNFDDAVAWQLRALDLAPADAKDHMRMCLELYEAGKPYHEE